MNSKILFLTLGLLTIPGVSVAATCSQANLTRCLDSVCAINVSSNPSARCQYCGTSSAGTPPTKSGMQSLSLGQSAKYTLSEKELKNAPTDPGQRYAWATEQYIKKIDGCTPDDVSDIYDKLIELGGGGVNLTGNTDSQGRNPIPYSEEGQYNYGISGINMELKDDTYYSIIYQILVDEVGWIEPKSDGVECVYKHNKPFSAIRIALIPKNQKEHIYKMWKEDIGTFNGIY